MVGGPFACPIRKDPSAARQRAAGLLEMKKKEAFRLSSDKDRTVSTRAPSAGGPRGGPGGGRAGGRGAAAYVSTICGRRERLTFNFRLQVGLAPRRPLVPLAARAMAMTNAAAQRGRP